MWPQSFSHTEKEDEKKSLNDLIFPKIEFLPAYA